MRRLIWVFAICKCSLFWIFFILHKCNKHVPRIVYIDFFGKLFCGVSSGSSLFVNAPFFYFFLINAITTSQQLRSLIFRQATILPKMGSISPRLCDTRESDHLHRLFKSTIFLALIHFLKVVTITLQNTMGYMVKSIA